ncbi:hypothetical protein Y032_0009g657 [Ancylostoma ceylanicum]|uniref:Uncharacterized protein n=1 Tax=Ancylostoma ceylanicum TaxID=53326 RepID=A0A016VJV8_9BILA|nr:hypothetical protein Y032_0009g657 [Ancylostoma ceylanicum]
MATRCRTDKAALSWRINSRIAMWQQSTKKPYSANIRTGQQRQRGYSGTEHPENDLQTNKCCDGDVEDNFV